MRRTFVLLKIETLQIKTYGGLSALFEANKEYLDISISTLQKWDWEHDYESKEKSKYKIHADYAKSVIEVRNELKLQSDSLLINII